RTRMSTDEYLTELHEHAGQIFAEGVPAGYPRALAAVVTLALDKVNAADPAAAQLLVVCAYLAPEPVPLTWFTRVATDTECAGWLPEPLRATAAGGLALRTALGRLADYGL